MRSSDGDARTNSAVLRILSHLLRLLDHPISEMEDAQARTAGARVFLEVFSSKIADSLTIEMLCGIFRHPPSVKPWTAAFVLSAKAFVSEADIVLVQVLKTLHILDVFSEVASCYKTSVCGHGATA
jgi:hypothetical protein